MANRWLFNGNRRWYTHLIDNEKKKGLLSDHQIGPLSGKVILCYETVKGIRYFSMFDTFLDFLMIFINRPIDDRYFHEVILGENPLKLYFDIDVDLLSKKNFDEKLLFSQLVKTLLAYFIGEGIKLNLNEDFIWLTSHGETKRSYHLIIDNYFFFNMKEVSHVINQIKTTMDPEVQSYFDWGVYTSKKNFRTLGSFKRGTNRIFKFQEEWIVEDIVIKYKYRESFEENPERIRLMLQFEASLITNTCHCSPMLPKVIDTGTKIFSKDLSDPIVNSSIELLSRSADVKVEELPFKISKVIGNLIVLERKGPTLCRICDVVHEHENPYLQIKNTSSGTEVTYYCRRAGKKGVSIGVIPNESPTMLTKEDKSDFDKMVKKLNEERNLEMAKKGSTSSRSSIDSYKIIQDLK